MKEERLLSYSDLWTTDAGRYALIEVDPTRPGACAVKDLQTGGLLVIDDDDDVIEAVILKMRSSGVPVLTPEEARTK